MDLKSYLLIAFIFVSNVSSEFSVNSTMKEQCPNVKTSVVSVRKRRHIAFPAGSAASVSTIVLILFSMQKCECFVRISQLELSRVLVGKGIGLLILP